MLTSGKKCKGAISVFLTLILLPTFIFGGVIVDGSRILGAKNMISGAGDLAMNAALSNYHEELNETYGLLAMAETPQEVEAVMKDCFESTLNAAGVSRENFNKALIYLELTDDFSAVPVEGSGVYETEILKQEILEYMKYRAPVTLLDRALTDRLGDLENIEKEKKAADTQVKFESELDDVQDLFDEIKKLTDRQEEIYDSILDQAQLNTLLASANTSYDEITMLTVAYKRMMTCQDSENGDTESLMKKMVGYSCDVSNITADTASNIIGMIMVQNGMSGKNPDDILIGVSKDSEEYQEKQQLITEYHEAAAVMEEGKHNTEKQLDELVISVYAAMHTQRELAKEGENNCKELKEKVEKLVKELEKLKGKYEDWKTAVDDLPDGESKKSYEENIEEVSGFFEAEGFISGFKDKVENNETFYNEVMTQLDMVTFTGKKLDQNIKSKADFYGKAPTGSFFSAGDITEQGKSFKGNYKDTVIALSVVNMDLGEDEFVHLLKEKYCKKDESNKEQADQKTDEWNGKLETNLSKLDELLLSNDIPDLNIDAVGSGDLPSNWLGVRIAESEESKTGIAVEGGLDNKSTRKKVSDSGSNTLNKDNSSINQMSSLPQLLAVGGEAVAEPLFLTEYIMGMFSHYTSNKNIEGKEIEAQSLNGHVLKDNAAYRAEVEYILWGDPDIRDNVGITKSIIFAANFVFNMSFVFTDKTIKNDALLIAGLFPVGALAKTAIKCALQSMTAMIETVNNVIDITEGKAVPLVKTKNTWDTWLLKKGGVKKDNAPGFTYEDYLWILVCVKMFIPAEQVEMLARIADCIELNMTDKKSDSDNTLKSMFTMVQLEAKVSVDTYFLNKLNGAGYDVQKVDEETFRIPYTGIQGY